MGSVTPAVAKEPAGAVPRLRKAPGPAETKSLCPHEKSLSARAARERGESTTAAMYRFTSLLPFSPWLG